MTRQAALAPASPDIGSGAGPDVTAASAVSATNPIEASGFNAEEKRPASLPASISQQSSDDEDVFKEGGYGWVVVMAVNLLNAHTWGINSSYAVFLAYYLRAGTFPGATPMEYAFVGGLSIAIALLISPPGTYLIGKYGTKKTMSLGVVIQTIAFVGASFTTEMWHLILSQGIAFGMGMGFLFVASVGIPAQWFTKRRSLANGIAAAGSGLGGLIYSMGTNAMIKSIGLAWTFRVLAVLTFAVNGVCTLLIRDRNSQLGSVHIAFHMDLFKRPEYCLLLGWACFSLLGYVIVVFSLADYCQTVGFTAAQGAIVSSMFNLSQGLGRPIIGLASDAYGRINVAALGTLGASLASLLIWILAGRFFAGVIVFSLLGVFAGVMWATIAPLCAEVVDIAHLPSGLSLLWLVLVLPSTFAEVIGLSLRQPGSSGYLPVQLFTGLCYLMGFACAWLLRAWKIRQKEILGRDQGNGTGSSANAGQETNGQAESTAIQAQGGPESLGRYLMKGKWVFARHRV